MRCIAYVILMLCICAAPAHASPRKAVLGKVESYLESLTTIKADFVQIAPGGDLASGKFFLKRPGRMRWQYDPPVPVVMVSTEDFLRYYDYELDQISDIPLDGTLAGFLAKDDISFDAKVIKVIDAIAKDGVVRVKIEQAGKPEEGSLTMEFNETPLKLRNLILVDAEGKQTNISLNNAQYSVKLPDDLFVIKDTRLQGVKRR